MKIECDKDPKLKQEFYEFAEKHYVAESIAFLEDATMYKNFFFEKVRRIF